MIRRPPRSTRTDTLFPYTTLFRSMGAFVAASVLGTTPLHAGVTTPAKAPGYHEFEQSSDFYRKRKDRRHYSRDERIDRDTRIWRDNNGRYRCKKDNGTTGLLIGGAAIGRASCRERVWQYG